MDVSQVSAYIETNILHSKLYDNADTATKQKAVNQAVNMLFRNIDVYKSKNDIPVEDIAEQTIWLLKMDDTMQRVEMGANSISVDGISIGFKDMDRSIAPQILNAYGVTTVRRRKVGSYGVPLRDTFRVGQTKETDWRRGV